MTTLQKLKDRICDLLPELKNNNDSDKIIGEIRKYTMLEDWMSKLDRQMEQCFIEAISIATKKPIMIGDVLAAVNDNNLPDGYLFFNANWRGYIELSGIYGRKLMPYRYNKPIDEWPEETIEFLYNLLK